MTEINDRIGIAEKVRFVGIVRGILKNNRLVFDEDYIEAYRQICQLFPQPLPDFVGDKGAVTQCEPQPLDDNIKGRLPLWEEAGKTVGELTMNRPLDDKELRERINAIVCAYGDDVRKANCLGCIDFQRGKCLNPKIEKILALLQPKIEEEK